MPTSDADRAFAGSIPQLYDQLLVPADKMQLPFADASFDLVLCQFGAMFFPDKGAAFAEARRVLRPGGRFIFNVWDRLEANEFADVVTRALAQCFPLVPPRFMARVPHGYHQQSTIGRDLARGGFAGPPGFDTLPQRSRADSALLAATAYCQGTLLRNEIEAQGGSRLAEATEIVAAAIAARFGSGPVEGAIQAHVVTVQREAEDRT